MSLTLQLISDTHSNLSRFKPSLSADLIIHAGDFTSYVGDSVEQITLFKDMCDFYDKSHLIVLGNHDYYGFVYRKDLLECLDNNHINYLTVNKEFKYRNYTFIGDTLFTNFRNLPNPNIFKHFISDFNFIKNNENINIQPEDYVNFYNDQLNFINKYRNKSNIVVVTHFPPSIELTDPQYEGNFLNPYFINDIDLKGFNHWICGHTHYTTKKIIDNCNCYINASGYISSDQIECSDFDKEYLIYLD